MTTYICCDCDTYYANEDRKACSRCRYGQTERCCSCGHIRSRSSLGTRCCCGGRYTTYSPPPCNCTCHLIPFQFDTVWGSFFFPPEQVAS